MATEAPKTTLPSVVAAEQFLNGEEGGLAGVITSLLGRAVVISLGLLAVGERKHVIKYSLAGATAIEVFVLIRIKTQLALAKQNP